MDETEVRATMAIMLTRKKLVLVQTENERLIASVLYGDAEANIAQKLSLLDRACALFSEHDAALFIDRLEDEFGIVYKSHELGVAPRKMAQ